MEHVGPKNEGQLIANRLGLKMNHLVQLLDQQFESVEKLIADFDLSKVCERIDELVNRNALQSARAIERMKWMVLDQTYFDQFIQEIEHKILADYNVSLIVDLEAPVLDQSMVEVLWIKYLLVDVLENILTDPGTRVIYLKIFVVDNDLWLIFRDNGVRSPRHMYSNNIQASIAGLLHHISGTIDQRLISLSCNETKIVIPIKACNARTN